MKQLPLLPLCYSPPLLVWRHYLLQPPWWALDCWLSHLVHVIDTWAGKHPVEMLQEGISEAQKAIFEVFFLTSSWTWNNLISRSPFCIGWKNSMGGGGGVLSWWATALAVNNIQSNWDLVELETIGVHSIGCQVLSGLCLSVYKWCEHMWTDRLSCALQALMWGNKYLVQGVLVRTIFCKNQSKCLLTRHRKKHVTCTFLKMYCICVNRTWRWD